MLSIGCKTLLALGGPRDRTKVPECACAAESQSRWAEQSPERRFKAGIKHYYSARSTSYDQEGSFHPKMVRMVVDLADLQPGQRCLDLCTGTGQVAVQGRQRLDTAGSVVGVDFSRSMLDVAAQKPGFDKVLLHKDVEDLPDSRAV